MNGRTLFGLGMLALAAVIIFLIQTGPCKLLGIGCPSISLRGLACGSKADLLKDSNVRSLMLDRYQIGNIDCPATPSTDCGDEAKLKDKDFIWPAGLAYLDMCRRTLGRNLDYDVIYLTPIVFYSWNCVTDELVRRGDVVQRDDVYYVADMRAFTKMIITGTSWEGACGVNGKVVIIPTDPVKSASGLEFTTLLLAMLNGGEVVDERTVEPLLPTIKRYIDSLGILEETSAKLFANCVRRGQGGCPIFTVYESQGIDLVKANPSDKTILNAFRTIYPQPTVLADHEIIALTPKGKRFLDAMKDKDIQAILWNAHGFRTGSIMDPKVHAPMHLPETIGAVVNLPSAAVQDRIVEYLKSKATSTATK